MVYAGSELHVSFLIKSIQQSLDPFIQNLLDERNVWLQVVKLEGKWTIYQGAESRKSECFIMRNDSLIYYDANDGAVSLSIAKIKWHEKIKFDVCSDWWFAEFN